MKHISPLLITLFALSLGISNAWAETATIASWKNQSLAQNTAVAADGGDANNKSKATISSSVALTSKGTNAYYASSGGGTKIQFSNLNLSSYTDISMTFYSRGSKTGAITTSAGSANIKVTTKEAQYTISNIPNTTTSLTLTYGATSGSFYFGTVVISGTKSGGSETCTKPTFTIEDKTITLEEADAADYDLASNLTINQDGSIGNITYECENDHVIIDGNKFYSDYPGTYTITATMAADDTYCEATATFTITVQAAPCTQLSAPTGLSASATAYDSATLSWTAVENATKYQITTTPPTFGGSQTHETTGVETTCTATDLSPETTYTWTVKAIGNGTTYCDSKESAEGTFTTPAKPKYTITWSTPLGTKTTSVPQDEKIGTLPDAPAAPQGCPDKDKVFVGWSENNIGTTGTDVAPTFISAETTPTANTTYYAIFATATESSTASGSLDITISNFTEITTNYNTVYTHTYPDATIEAKGVYNDSKGIQMNSGKGTYIKNTTALPGPITNITCTWSATGKNSPTLYVAKGGVASTSSTNLGKQANTSQTQSIDVSASEGYDYFYFDGTTVTGACYLTSLKITYGGGSTTTYTDYVTNCVDCTAPTTPLALSVADATLNLGEDGTVMTTFSTTGGNGGKIDYVVNPTTGADIDKDNKTITFTQAETYTLTAQQALNTTTEGTTYCGSRVSQTITVTKNPVWNLTGTLSPFETTCTEASAVQQVHLSGYNLTTDVKASLQPNSAFSLSANQTDWSKSITLPIDENGKVDAAIYVRLDKSESCPAAATNARQGTITISSTGIANLEQSVSGTISAPAVKVSLNDQETTKQITGQRLCCQIEEQTLIDKLTPIDCEGVHFSHFVTDPTKLETPIAFPYDITTTDDITFYAVYCKETSFSKTQYRKGSINDLTDGQKVVIVEYTDNQALGSEVASDTYNLSAKDVSPNNDEITVTDETIVWTVTTSGDKYKFSQGENYLNVISTTSGSKTYYNLKCTATEDEFSVEEGGLGYTLESTNLLGQYIEYFQGKFTTYTGGNDKGYYMQFYVPVANCTYVLKPCGPYIKATGDVAITSGKGIWVESVTPLTISAKNLDKNDGGENGTPASVTITATVTDDAAAKGFSIKTPGTQDSGAKSVTLASSLADATWDGALTVVYTPTTYDVTAEGKIALRVYKSNGSTTYATDTIVVRGRSLPAEFVIAAKTKDGWVALPSDLAVGSTGTLKYPYSIVVDNDAAPTKATEAPETAIYMPAERSVKNTAATAIRLKNTNNLYLQGSTSDGQTNVWLSNQNSEQAQSWELRGEDFTHYFVRMHASETGRYLSYDATQGKIGNYMQMASLHILPVEKTCVRFDAPKLNDHTLTSTSATILWEAIAGVAEYEYSLDNGTTWQTCTDVQIMGTAIQWTLSGLKTETQYTVWIRAKAADGKTNCSDYDSETFTTTSCDDVPTDLWSSATANSVTITWNAKAATATVKIYSDEKGENLVQSVPNLSSPAKIVGLAPNTKYYFQVFASGTCASAIDNFWTESNEVSIVEWEKEAVIVDINTDVTDADDVSILVENQTTHGSNNKNIADDLFFSKYYEASGELKLVAIYNGTRDTLPLTNIQLKVGTSKWNTTIPMNQYGKFKAGHIAPDEEIIIWHKSKNTSTNECVANTMDVRIMDENTSLSFGGRASIGLFRSGDLIDIIGAGTIATSIEGTCRPSWGDANGWCGSGYNIEKNTEEIELSTNRCLLVRSNKVKSGANAVANNTSTFATFTKDEWLGRQVPDDDDTEETVSCEGFAYVADFNYNDYYTTYDSVAKLEIKGNRNPDGTYTIPVPRMDTMACTNMRLQLKKAGVVIASREYKVPIVVDKSINTQDATYFGGDKLTDEVCATCDVVVRDKARLEHVAGGKQQFREMYVYAGSTFFIPEGQKMTLDKVRMFAQNDNVSYAIINNSNATDAAISVKEVSHIKRIDGKYWYPFSLPYDCNIADIDQLSGQTLGVYGEDWGIKFYDGERRQRDGNSTTHYGEVSKYWTMMPADGVLKAYTGYIIGLFVPAADEALMKSVNFPPAILSAYTEDATSKTTPITNWPDNLTAQSRHHGWNFVGSPYISLFGAATTGEGLYNNQLTMGWTDAYGEQQDKEHIYVSIPDGGNSNTYTQALAAGVTIKPFTAYFVQAVDPENNQSNTLQLTYSKANQRLLASPARAAADAEPLILAELDIRCGALHDNTGVLVSDVYSADYEIGDDLYKMYAAAAKPQLYTTDASNEKMAYQALPDLSAHAVPLGIYLPAAGDYTLSLNRSVSRVAAAEAVYLLHDGKVVADLLQTDYTLTAAARGTLSGYTLDIRRAPKMPTDILPAAGDAPYLIARDGMLTVANLPAEAIVQVYDVLGRVLLRTTATEQSLSVPTAQTGVYTVLITTDNLQTVLKTLLR